jgi:Domain of unknown function (DUF4386)
MKSDTSSVQRYARTAGALYLIIIVLGVLAQFFVREKLIHYGDAAVTAGNIAGADLLFRLGFFSDLLTIVCDVAMELLFYILLRHVNKNLAVLVVLFALLGDAIMATTELNQYAATLLLGSAKYLTPFTTAQLQSLVLFNLNAQTGGLLISMVFFGFHCLFLGYLIFKSSFFPKTIGVLVVIGGAALLTNSFASLVMPSWDLPELILLPDFISELAFCVWLIVKGVNLQKWRQVVELHGRDAALPP